MFYLVSFLTMLVSLLIYMMDPVPMESRQKLDTHNAEGYVVGFVNQHQAARDYMYHWLGRIWQYNNQLQSYVSGGSLVFGPTVSPMAIALPVEDWEPFFPLPDFMSERFVLGNVVDGSVESDGNGYISFASGGGTPAGSYASALVCLDVDGNLTPCYRYGCQVAANTVIVQPTCAQANIVSVLWANDVTPYIVTYSNNDGVDPAWWGLSGKPRALRYELWRRAMSTRTNFTYNCGVISQAREANTGSGRWNKSGKGRIDWVDESGDHRYCINNGQRCRALLPEGMREFLTAVVTNTAGDTSLSGVFFCATAVKNPYDAVIRPDWHFDGIDNRAKGAFEHAAHSIGAADQTWYVTGITNNSKYISWVDGNWGEPGYKIPNQFAIGPVAGTGIEMPFTQVGTNFTLNVVMHFGNARGLNSNWYIGTSSDAPAAPAGAYGLYIDNNNRILFFPNSGSAGVDITAEIDTGDIDDLLTGVHAWTIVRKDNKMGLYVDGNLVVEGLDGEAPASVPGNVPVVIGRVRVGIGDVRYYNQALTPSQIRQNFKIDSRRYGIRSNITWK